MAHTTVNAHVLWLSILFGLVASSVWATTAVVLQTSGFIIIAVDSKAGGTGPHGRVPYNTCKIIVEKSRGMAAVAAGLDFYRFTNFDISTELSQAMRRAANVSEAREIADKMVAKDLARAVIDEKRRLPKDFANTKGVQYVIAGTEPSGQTTVALTEFYVDRAAKVSTKPAPLSQTPQNKLGEFFIGNDAAILDYIRKTPGWKYRGTVPMVAKTLVQIEINAMPDEVGGPIAVLFLNRSNARWIEPGICDQ